MRTTPTGRENPRRRTYPQSRMAAGQPTPPSPSGVARSRFPALDIRVPRHTLVVALGVVVSASSLWLVLRRVSLAEVWASLEYANWAWLLPAVALTYLTLGARALRWRYLFVEPERVSTWESAKATNVGLFFNNILPSRAGEVPRIFALGRGTGISKVEIGATVVVERLLDVLTIAVAALIAWPWLPDASWVQALCIICAAIVVGFVGAATAAFIFRERGRRLLERGVRALPFVSTSHAASLSASLARGVRVVSSPRRLGLTLALSGLVWMATALSVLALFPAFDLPASLVSAWLIVIVTSIALTVPSTSGALGVYEAGVQASLVAVGATTSTALSFAIVLHAVNFIPISLTGLVAGWGYLTRTPEAPALVASSPTH